MARVTLETVANLARFRCRLCDHVMSVEAVDAHADRHARRGECLRYSEYECASRLDPALEGYPISLDGVEMVWPFVIENDNLCRLLQDVPCAG